MSEVEKYIGDKLNNILEQIKQITRSYNDGSVSISISIDELKKQTDSLNLKDRLLYFITLKNAINVKLSMHDIHDKQVEIPYLIPQCMFYMKVLDLVDYYRNPINPFGKAIFAKLGYDIDKIHDKDTEDINLIKLRKYIITDDQIKKENELIDNIIGLNKIYTTTRMHLLLLCKQDTDKYKPPQQLPIYSGNLINIIINSCPSARDIPYNIIVSRIKLSSPYANILNILHIAKDDEVYIGTYSNILKVLKSEIDKFDYTGHIQNLYDLQGRLNKDIEDIATYRNQISSIIEIVNNIV